MKETEHLRNLMESVAYGIGEKERLKEYFNQKGNSLVDCLYGMNVYFDLFGPDEEEIGARMETDEYANSPEWQAIANKFMPIVKRLETMCQRANRGLTEQEAKAADQVIYDGSDAYDSLEDSISFLPGLYSEQVNFMRDLLDGTIDFSDSGY